MSNSHLNVIDYEEHRGFIIKIVPDEHPENPRIYDDYSKMICFHKKYNLGDKHKFSDPDEFEEFYNDPKNYVAMRLPLFIYDHSGIVMQTKPFSDLFDSGQVGWIYITKDNLSSIFKNSFSLKSSDEQKIIDFLNTEVDVYSTFISGNFVGYHVEDPEGNIIDSCFGYTKIGFAKSDAENFIENYINSQN